MADRGIFISFEGIDRSGKSTQAALLAERLGERAMLVREPGGTELSERVRVLLKDPSVPMSDRSEALLFAGARADLVASVIRPALQAGRVVIADRFIDSSLAYQGAARGLGVDQIASVNFWACDGVLPDLTVLVSVDPEVAVGRGVEENDRFENEGIEFQRAVAEAYDEIAVHYSERVTRVDGDGSVEVVAGRVWDVVAGLLGGGGSPV